MSKVTKEFWVNNSELEDIDKSSYCCIQLAKNRNMVHRNKITITYEIDQEVTIKESEFDKICDELYLGTAKFKNTVLYFKLKEGFFGGGDNE